METWHFNRSIKLKLQTEPIFSYDVFENASDGHVSDPVIDLIYLARRCHILFQRTYN